MCLRKFILYLWVFLYCESFFYKWQRLAGKRYSLANNNTMFKCSCCVAMLQCSNANVLLFKFYTNTIKLKDLFVLKRLLNHLTDLNEIRYTDITSPGKEHKNLCLDERSNEASWVLSLA